VNIIRNLYSRADALIVGALDAVEREARKHLRPTYIPDYSTVVGHEDLSASITAVRRHCAGRGMALFQIDDEIAADLIAHYVITKRK
jgi:hypothetical protein